MQDFLVEYKNKEYPKFKQIFKLFNLTFNKVVDVGAEIGLSAQLFKEFGAKEIIGYEIDKTLCDAADRSLFSVYYCREMTKEEYLSYQDYFIKMDCEGCEEKYLDIIPEHGLISLHDWTPNHLKNAERLWIAGYIPVFHSYDWHEITYLKS